MNPTGQKIILSRLGIFILQLIAIATLLWASEYSLAERDEAPRPEPCSTESCKRTHPYYNTIPIPSKYKSKPPDEGFWYTRKQREDQIGRVWVPGLTDKMNASTKEAYYEMQKGPLGAGWKVVRVDVAHVLQLVQDKPSTKCYDNMQAASAGQVRLTCNYTVDGESKTAVFSNLTSMSFNDHFDDQFTTVAEYHTEKMNKTENRNSDEFGGVDSSPYDKEAYDSHGNLIYTEATARGTSSKSTSGSNSGYSQATTNRGSAYARYITNHVAPNYKNINRSTAAVFSAGNEQGVTLEEILKKKNAEYAPGIAESNAKSAKTPSPKPDSPPSSGE